MLQHGAFRAGRPVRPLGEVAAAAQDSPVESTNEPARALKDGKVLRAARIVGAPPAIDGSLTDEVWTAAAYAGDYIQRDPDNGAAMTEVTRIQVAYDDRYLYIAIRCEDGSPANIGAGLGRRDELPSTDYVSIGFDPRRMTPPSSAPPKSPARMAHGRTAR